MTKFVARDDLVLFGTDAGRFVVRRLSDFTERELIGFRPDWDSRPGNNQALVYVRVDAGYPRTSRSQYRTLQLDTCELSDTIATTSFSGTPLSSVFYGRGSFCGDGVAYECESLLGGRSILSFGSTGLGANSGYYEVPQCNDELMTWWSQRDGGTFINWSLLGRPLFAQRLLGSDLRFGRLPLVISSRWTAWPEERLDGGVILVAIENDTLTDGGAARPLAPLASTPGVSYFDLGLREDLATWREFDGVTDTIVVQNLRDGGRVVRQVDADARHAIVGEGVVILTGGSLTWDPGFHP